MAVNSAVTKHIMFIRLFLPEKGNIIAVILVLINGQTQENNFAGKNVCYYLFSEVLDNGKSDVYKTVACNESICVNL